MDKTDKRRRVRKYAPERRPYNGMHPTRDTLPLINLRVVGVRVMPGVRHPHFRQ